MTTQNKNSQQLQPTKPLLKVMRDGQICPDGVVIDINWGALEVGMSVFIPAVNLKELKKQVESVANTKQVTLKGVERIENGKLGMRFWRTL